jgi:hypothetical protein
MRRTALLAPLFGIILAMPACAGLDDFLGTTFSSVDNPHKPAGDSLTMRRVQGLVADAQPIVPEPGNVWPRGVDRMPTLQDITPEQAPAPRASSHPRSSRIETPAPAPQAALPLAPVALAPSTPAALALPTSMAAAGSAGNRYQTVSTPTGTAVLVPNGNGTTTLMRSDGAMETVPTTR